MNPWLKQVKFVHALAIAIVISTIYVPEALAKPARSPNLLVQILRFFTPRDNRNRESPAGRQKGGATRDRCPTIQPPQPPLTALVPATPDGTPFVEKTIQDRPIFWFYVPFVPTSSRNAEFAIFDESEKDVYAAKFLLTQQPGIVRLQLPNTMPALQEGKRYRWVFSVICNAANRSGDATVNGWVQRVSLTPELNRQLQQKNELTVISAYANAALWHEMLTAMAEFQRQKPQNSQAKATWMSTLHLLGLTKPVSDHWNTYRLPLTSPLPQTSGGFTKNQAM
ncbi:MAG: DUF928 domain-containing protein [Stenomitos rutilans HA7619-LM2]|jgi:hypothetical protein|nr:DUF928 domain-containing protein [Stenomitos rutilans HA7619-LM2]